MYRWSQMTMSTQVANYEYFEYRSSGCGTINSTQIERGEKDKTKKNIFQNPYMYNSHLNCSLNFFLFEFEFR